MSEQTPSQNIPAEVNIDIPRSALDMVKNQAGSGVSVYHLGDNRYLLEINDTTGAFQEACYKGECDVPNLLAHAIVDLMAKHHPLGHSR